MLLTLTALLAAQAAPAAPAAAPAPAATPTCTPGTAVVAPFAAWVVAHPLEHGFEIERAVDLPVAAVATVRLAVQPSKPLSGTHLATASFTVKTAGRYAVAVGGAKTRLRPVWLDVAGADRKPLKSVGHGHGQPCTTITKVVDYQLAPGTYTLLATGLTRGDEAVRVLVVPRG